MRFTFITALCAMIVIAPAARAQNGAQDQIPRSTDGTDPAGWNLNRDGPIAAPGNHKVIFENDAIRAQSVTVPAHSEEPYHLHPYYSLLIFDSSPANIVDRDGEGKEIQLKAEVVIGVTKTYPLVMWQPPNALHSIENMDDKDVHLIRIEDKKGIMPLLAFPDLGLIASQTRLAASTDGSDPATWNPKNDSLLAAPGNHKVLFEDDILRVISVTVPAHSIEPYHDHPYYSLLVVDSDARIVDHDGAGNPLPAPAHMPAHAPFGFLQPPQAMHAVQNLDPIDSHLIRIEFKKFQQSY